MATGARRVVITGMGVVSAIGCSLTAFEGALRVGRSGIVARGRPAVEPGSAVEVAAVLREFSWADRIAETGAAMEAASQRARRIVNNTTDSTRWTVVAAMQAWGQAGLGQDTSTGVGTGLIVGGNNLSQGYTFQNAARLLRPGARINPKYALSFLDTNHLGCVSEILGIRGGPGWTVGAASASGNAAIQQGWWLIRTGMCERCLVVGAGCEFSPAEFEGFATLGAASTRRVVDGAEPEGLCRPFDSDHSGFVWGEGAGALVLETAEAAARRGAEVLAEVAGAAMTLDGTHLPEPNVEGEVRVMRQALASAGLDPKAVEYVNTHGSSSPLGDRTECEAIRTVFGEGAESPLLNATKALTGHCISASGMLEAVACVVQMRGGFLHPNPRLDRPIAPALRWVGREAELMSVRCAVSNAFGFGGINSSVVLVAA